MIEFRSMPIQDGPHNIEIYIKGVLQPSYAVDVHMNESLPHYGYSH